MTIEEPSMIRKTLLVISLVLLVGTVGLWVESLWFEESLGWSGESAEINFSVDDQCVILDTILWSTGNEVEGPKGFWHGRHEPGGMMLYGPLSFEFSSQSVAGSHQMYTVVVPLWTLIVLFALFVWLAVRNVVRPQPQNLCLKCGYDLTGNVSGRCSECGTIIEGASETT